MKFIPPLLADQVIDVPGYDRLWRAQQASELLSRLTDEVATAAGITHDNTAALAEYISDDMRDVLNRSTPVEELI